MPTSLNADRPAFNSVHRLVKLVTNADINKTLCSDVPAIYVYMYRQYFKPKAETLSTGPGLGIKGNDIGPAKNPTLRPRNISSCVQVLLPEKIG